MLKSKTLTVVISSIAVVLACAALVAFVGSGGNPAVELTYVPSDVQRTDVPSDTAAADEQASVTETLGTICETVTNVANTQATAASTFAYPTQISGGIPSYVTDGGDTPEPQTQAVTEPQTTVQQEVTEQVTTKPSGQTTTKPTTAKPTTAKPTATKPAVTSSGKLAKDMTFAGLYTSGYDVIGYKKYIYNNDKDCAQSKFGYNRFYDKAAVLADFHIDTVRIEFKNYQNKDWMVQMWKGTYITGDIGTVGCEIGLYNRPIGKSGGMTNHYNCAPEEDWLNMEMTFYWDENYDGNFKPQFTRNYGPYWWPTGFVDGQLRNVKDTSCLRILGRITFKDSVQADKFEAAMANVGFNEVSTFSPFRKDTYKRQVCDVIFCWQDARD